MAARTVRDWLRESRVGAVGVAICFAYAASLFIEALTAFAGAVAQREFNRVVVGYFPWAYPIGEEDWQLAGLKLLMIPGAVLILLLAYAVATWVFPATNRKASDSGGLS